MGGPKESKVISASRSWRNHHDRRAGRAVLPALRSRSTRRPRHEAENHQVLTAGVREAAEILVAIESTGGA